MTIMEVVREKGLLLDGAMGTMLIQAGLQGGKLSETWVLERPEVIKKIHQAYFDAGADMATACTFSANSLKLKNTDLEDRCDEINREGIRIAREAAGKKGYVAGNFGPSGLLLEPSGPLKFEEVKASYAKQASVLAKSVVDLFIMHTFYDLNEALAAIKGIRSISQLPIFASMTFQENPRGFATMMGNPVESSMKTLLDAGATVVGANCSLTSDKMLAVAEEVRRAVSEPVMIRPNAGMPQIKDGKTFYPENAKIFSENMCRIKSLGVEVLGGCCGSTPECIRRLAEKLGQQ